MREVKLILTYKDETINQIMKENKLCTNDEIKGAIKATICENRKTIGFDDIFKDFDVEVKHIPPVIPKASICFVELGNSAKQTKEMVDKCKEAFEKEFEVFKEHHPEVETGLDINKLFSSNKKYTGKEVKDILINAVFDEVLNEIFGNDEKKGDK